MRTWGGVHQSAETAVAAALAHAQAQEWCYPAKARRGVKEGASERGPLCEIGLCGGWRPVVVRVCEHVCVINVFSVFE